MARGMSLLVAMVVTSQLIAGESREPGLVAHYRFAEGHGDRLLDHNGHGHHGRIRYRRHALDRWCVERRHAVDWW